MTKPTEISPEARECAEAIKTSRWMLDEKDILAVEIQQAIDKANTKLEEENTRLKESLASLESIVKSKQKIINSNDDNLESWIESAANKINALEESIRVKDVALGEIRNQAMICGINSGCWVNSEWLAKRSQEALSHNTGRKEAITH